MKTHKRDRVERAYHLGYKAGIRGKSTEICPFEVAGIRGSRLGGWRDGRDASIGLIDLEDL